MFIGRVIAQYRIVERIGAGGMGEVFLAEDLILHRRVALKFLIANATPDQHSRILAEARAAASIDHPYICKIYEVGEGEGKSFIAMEFIEGGTLAERLTMGRLPPVQACSFAAEIAEALAEAHGCGIIHCDLKPRNVIVARNGHVKLTDFGLARTARPIALGPDEPTLPMGEAGAGGTPAYMAPEQVRGEPLDARADVFAFGILFFEMLAGVHPFKKSTQEGTVTAILHDDPPAIDRFAPDADPRLAGILSRALAKNCGARYASASELWSDIAGVTSSRAWQNKTPILPVIAILPFRDLSPQGDQEYFCDGLAEELIVALTGIDRLRVVSRSAAFRFRNPGVSLTEIGTALNATTVLEGSVRKSGDRIRIVLNLVELPSGFPVWSERFDRRLDDIFEVQEEIARAVAAKLRIGLAASDFDKLKRSGSNDVQAYELYLKGRYFWNKRTEQNIQLSIEQFTQALAADPQYALAYAGLADAYVTLGLHGAIRPAYLVTLARNAAGRALELKPQLPEALVSRACIRAILEWDWSAAEREFETAIGLNSRSAQARQWFAMNCLAPRRQFARAREHLHAASELEPGSLAIATSLGALDFFQQDFNGAVTRLREVMKRDPEFYLAHYFLGQACAELGQFDEATRELERAVVLTERSGESLSALGYVLAVAGRRDEAERIVQELNQRERATYVSPVVIAQVQAAFEDFDSAIANLDLALSIRSTDLIWLAVRPAFRKVLNRDRVARILKWVGLKSEFAENPMARGY